MKIRENQAYIVEQIKRMVKSCYIGSGVDLSIRFRNYFSKGYLEKPRQGKTAINKALLKYGYANFQLDIIEYVSKEKAIEIEQYYMDLLNPQYNLLKVAGSRLGYKHSRN